MNIPLDRLYHYIENVAQEIYSDRIIIYRFWPHGSKNINDLNNLANPKLNEWRNKTVCPIVWCNDQEPLDHEFYQTNLRDRPDDAWITVLKSADLFLPPTNLNYRRLNIFEKNLLLHSEQRSTDSEKYRKDNQLIPVYYWSHAVIARDWFRYAEHVKQTKQVNRTFLIYNRAWSNTREYRLKFAELLVRLGLQKSCQTSVNPIEPELDIHYKFHQFKNPTWRPQIVLENYFPTNDAHSSYSATFDLKDYEATDIEVVLETLFDDGRLHLTEKSLRPIACGQPFILAGTAGSLEYLRNYGFITFGDIWDESYDLIEDPEERLTRIADLMRQIANWAPEVREQKMVEARAIAEYNRQHFFSQDFFNLIINELKTNLTVAFDELTQTKNYRIDHWNKLALDPQVIEFVTTNQQTHLPTKTDIDEVLNLIQKKLK